MQNLLPSVPDTLEETRKRVERISNWRPDDADPTRAVIDRKLYSEFTVDKIEVIKYRQARLPKPEPNYVSPQELLSLDESPLNAAVRNEEVEESIINMEGMVIDSGIPVLVKPKKKKVSTKFDHFLYTKFYSKMPVITDLYVQKLRTMKVMALQPFGELLRLIEGDPKFAQFVEYNGVHCLCSPLVRSTVAMTTRREIKDYHFNKYERIGLEVEMVDGKLTCTRVIPGTQAYAHELNLDSAEIVGVNGERVVNLEEFQRAMQRARQEKFFLGELPDDNAELPIVLTVAAFKGGKSKIDDVYLHSFAQRERMKSLFSNIFASSSGGNRGVHDDDTSVNSNDLESRDASFSVPDGDNHSVASASVYEEAAEAARKAVAEAEAKDAASVASSQQQNASRSGISSRGGGGGGGGHSSSNSSLKSNNVGGSTGGGGGGGGGGGLDALGSGRNSVRSLTSSQSRRRRVLDQTEYDDEDDVDYKGTGRGDDGKEGDDQEEDDDDDLRSHHSHQSRQPFQSSRHNHYDAADEKDADDKSVISQLSGESKSIASSSHHHHHQHRQHHHPHAADSKSHPQDTTTHAAQAKASSSGSSHDGEPPSQPQPQSSHMHVQAVNILHEMHMNYGDSDEGSETGGMRAGRKTVTRDTVPPEATEPVKEPTPPPTPPPEEPQPPVEEEEERRPPPKKRDRLLEKPPRILPFTSLVCVPPALKGSIDWGLPENYIQFTNFTSHNSWKMEIYWVDSEGAMVLRHELKSGHTHMDMCTADHVWAIIARPHYDTSIKPMSRGGLSGGLSSSTTLQQSSSMFVNDKSMGTLNDGGGSGVDNDHANLGPEKIDPKQPLILILRPCSMALQEGKCLSMIWTPWQSLSISHIIHPQTTKSRPRHNSHHHHPHAHPPTAAEQHQAANATASHRDLPRIQPVMHIQLFETPTQRLRTIAGQYNIVSAQDPNMALAMAASSAAGDVADGNSQLLPYSHSQSHSHSHSYSDSVDHHHSPMNADAMSVASQQSSQQSLRSQHSSSQQPPPPSSTYLMVPKAVEKTVQDFKAAIQAANSRYQSHRGDFDPATIAAAKIQRKPLVTTGALHRMRKDHK